MLLDALKGETSREQAIEHAEVTGSGLLIGHVVIVHREADSSVRSEQLVRNAY